MEVESCFGLVLVVLNLFASSSGLVSTYFWKLSCFRLELVVLSLFASSSELVALLFLLDLHRALLMFWGTEFYQLNRESLELIRHTWMGLRHLRFFFFLARPDRCMLAIRRWTSKGL